MVTICKHFKKKENPANNLTFLNESSYIEANNKQLKDVFKYQRSIVIQTAIIRKKIGPELLNMIDKGKINELQELDVLSTFLSIYPKDEEI